MNFSGQKTRYPLHMRHICQAFGTAVRVLEVSGENNVLLLASRVNFVRFHPILADRALALEAGLGPPFRHYLARLHGSSLVRVAACPITTR